MKKIGLTYRAISVLITISLILSDLSFAFEKVPSNLAVPTAFAEHNNPRSSYLQDYAAFAFMAGVIGEYLRSPKCELNRPALIEELRDKYSEPGLAGMLASGSLLSGCDFNRLEFDPAKRIVRLPINRDSKLEYNFAIDSTVIPSPDFTIPREDGSAVYVRVERQVAHGKGQGKEIDEARPEPEITQPTIPIPAVQPPRSNPRADAARRAVRPRPGRR